jgi:DUF4097 and DUF4098 domain-containing protein YvlB
MRAMHRFCGALALIAAATPASAQDTQAIADAIQQAVSQARIVVLQAAQAGRDAGRAAAQAARQQERQRREDARRGPEITENFSRTVRLGRDGTFSLENVSGDVSITGRSGNDVRIDAVKRVRHPNPTEARAILQALTVDVAERGGNVDVRTQYPFRRNWSGSVDYTVTVPQSANVTLKSMSGTLKVTNVNGELRAESFSGEIVMSGVRKIRLAKTMSGDVQIADSEGDDLTASSYSGNVVMRNVKSRIVGLNSISGDVRLTDVETDTANLRTMSGNLQYLGRFSRNGRYEFQTHSGSVRITPVGAPNFTLAATTFSGHVRSDYPLTIQGDALGNGLAPRRNRPVRGTFGSGGAMLTLQSFSGDIVIVKQ